MATFQKKQIALAVGAALAATAGSAIAAPALRTNGVVASHVAGTKADFYGATGVAATNVNVKVFLQTESTAANGAIALADTSNANVANITYGNDTGGNDFSIYYKDSAGSTVSLVSIIDSTSVAVPAFDSLGATALTVTLKPTGSKAFRINAGKLEYAPDSASAFGQVFVASAGVNKFHTEMDSVAGYDSSGADSLKTFTLDSTAVVAGHTFVPVPTAKTRDADADGVVDGLSIETFAKTAALTTTNMKVVVRNNGTVGDSTNSAADSVAITPTFGGATPSWTLAFTPSGVNWTKGDSAADAAAINKILNTGITTDAPFVANVVSGLAIAYTEAVQESNGSTAFLYTAADSAATAGVVFPTQADYTDGAAPVVRTSVYTAASKTLKITFSESIASIASTAVLDGDVREAVQNIAYGTALPGTSLAAANFNSDGDIDTTTVSVSNDSTGGILSISKVPSEFLGAKILIAKRISLAEPGEGGYAMNDSIATATDTFGFKSSAAAGEVLTSGGTVTTTAAPVNLAFDEETTASGVLSGATVTRVDIVYPYAIKQLTGSSLKDHFKLTVYDGNTAPDTASSVTPDATIAYLDSTHVVIDTANPKLVKVTLPTALQRKHMSGLALEYNDAWGDGKQVLQFTDTAAGVDKAVTAANMSNGEISLPYFVTSGKAPLYTMEVDATVTNALAGGGSKVTTYLAKWLDAAVGTSYDTSATADISITSGQITNPGDKVATDLKLEVVGGSAIADAIAAELNKDKPGNIQAYVQLTRSNDAVKGGQASGTSNWLEGHAQLGLYGELAKAQTVGTGTTDPVYAVQLNVVTGQITGRLTGQVQIKKGTKTFVSTTSASGRGLAFIKSDGTLDSLAANGASVTQIVGTKTTNVVNVFFGVDATPATQGNLKDSFLLMVLEQTGQNPLLITSAEPGASNYLPFDANILSNRAGRLAFAVDSKLVVRDLLAASTSWQLAGVGNLDRKATAPNIPPNALPRLFTTLDNANRPLSAWTNDTKTTDLALTMLGGKTGVASEASSGDTISTISLGANASAQQFAFAIANDGGAATQPVFFLTKAAGKNTLPVGWSLISAPKAWETTIPSDVTHLLKVGAGYTTPTTWISGESPTGIVTENQPVFVYSKKPVPLN